MVTAIESHPGLDPDRASFTTALHIARDQLTAAQGICPTNPTNRADSADPDVIGRTILATLLPARRPRYSTRTVKCGTSRYHHRYDTRPALPTTITTIDITIHTPALTPPRQRRRRQTPSPHDHSRPCADTRRAQVIAIMNTQPHHHWNGAALARQLNIPAHNLLTQLAEWARRGLLTRTTKGHYTLNPPTT